MPLFLLVMVPAAFGLNPVIARALVDQFGPATLTLVRWSLSALLIGMVAVYRGPRERWRMPHAQFPRLILLGALGMGFCSYAAYAGVQTATATTVGLIYACTAAIVALIEIARGAQRVTLTLATGLVCCLIGVALVLLRGDLSTLATLTIGHGEAWAGAGTVMWAFYTVAMNRSPVALTPLAQFTLMSTASAVICLPIAIAELQMIGWPQVTEMTPLWIAGLVLIASCGSFIGYNLSLRANGPVLTSASISLSPVYIAILAVTLIGEQVAWYHLLAILLVVAGLSLINLDRVHVEAMARAA